MSKVIYRKGGGRRRVGFPLLVLCAVLLFGFSAVNMLWPKREQLVLENRKAAQRRSIPSVPQTRYSSARLRRAASCWARTAGCSQSCSQWTMQRKSS